MALTAGNVLLDAQGHPLTDSSGNVRVVPASGTCATCCGGPGTTIIIPPPPYNGVCSAGAICPGADAAYTPAVLSGCTMCATGFSNAVFGVTVPMQQSMSSYSGDYSAETIAWNPWNYGSTFASNTGITSGIINGNIGRALTTQTSNLTKNVSRITDGQYLMGPYIDTNGNYCAIYALALPLGYSGTTPAYMVYFATYVNMNANQEIVAGCYPSLIPANSTLGRKLKFYDPNGNLVSVGVAAGMGGYMTVQAGAFSGSTLSTASTLSGGPITAGIQLDSNNPNYGASDTFPTTTPTHTWNGYIITGSTIPVCSAAPVIALVPDGTAPGNWLGDWNGVQYAAGNPLLYMNGFGTSQSSINQGLSVYANYSVASPISTIEARYFKKNIASNAGTYTAWSPLIQPQTITVT